MAAARSKPRWRWRDLFGPIPLLIVSLVVGVLWQPVVGAFFARRTVLLLALAFWLVWGPLVVVSFIAQKSASLETSDRIESDHDTR
jgi:hypothetical protein